MFTDLSMKTNMTSFHSIIGYTLIKKGSPADTGDRCSNVKGGNWERKAHKVNKVTINHC